MTDAKSNVPDKTEGTNQASNLAEYDLSSGKSPLEWLEIKEGIHYSQLSKISGERKFLGQLAENPVISAGLLGGIVAIGGGLLSLRSGNFRLSNHFLKLRWGSSALVFTFVVSQIWHQIDWNPPAVQKLQKFIAESFKKDIGLLREGGSAESKVVLNAMEKGS